MATDLQKAGVMKRLSAFMLDLIIFILIASAVASLASWAIGYGKTADAFGAHYKSYGDRYEIDLNKEYTSLTPAERDRYQAAQEALTQDEQTLRLYRDLMIKTISIVAIALFVTFALTEVLVPLLFKNGQTLGKKAFAIGVMRVDGVRITPFQMVVRTIFGKCLMETMLPALLLIMSLFNMMSILLALVVAAVLLIFQIVLLIVTKTNSTIHDSVAVTVVVDMQTQMIFDTPEELMEYQKRLAAEEAERQSY